MKDEAIEAYLEDECSMRFTKPAIIASLKKVKAGTAIDDEKELKAVLALMGEKQKHCAALDFSGDDKKV